MGQASTRPKGYRSARAAEEGVWPRLRLGLGPRQPDDLLGLLRRAGPGRTADAPDPPGAGHGLEPKIPLYVSGFGPRAMELAGKHGDGLIFAIPPRGVAVAEALGHAHKGAARAGRALDGFRNCALTNVALLEPGEPVDSPRVVRTVGPTSWPAFTGTCVRSGSATARSWRRRPPSHYTYLHPGEAEP